MLPVYNNDGVNYSLFIAFLLLLHVKIWISNRKLENEVYIWMVILLVGSYKVPFGNRYTEKMCIKSF